MSDSEQFINAIYLFLLLFIFLFLLVVLPELLLLILIILGPILVIWYVKSKSKKNEAIEFVKNNPKYYSSCPSCNGTGIVRKFVHSQAPEIVVGYDSRGQPMAAPTAQMVDGSGWTNVTCSMCNGIGYLSSDGNATTVDKILKKKAMYIK